MIDIDKLEALTKTVTSGAAAQKSADPVIRNMGRLEFDDACKQYMRATNPAAIRELIAEVRALREDAERYRYLRSIDRRACLEAEGPAAGCWIDCEDEDGTLVLLTEEDADAAIDTARKGKA